jgi:hypothetical protein
LSVDFAIQHDIKSELFVNLSSRRFLRGLPWLDPSTWHRPVVQTLSASFDQGDAPGGSDNEHSSPPGPSTPRVP